MNPVSSVHGREASLVLIGAPLRKADLHRALEEEAVNAGVNTARLVWRGLSLTDFPRNETGMD